MKKIVTIIALALVCSGAYAQFNQGRILAGGSLSFQTQTVKSEVNGTTNTLGNITDIGFNPKVGYFFIDNLAGGLGVDITAHTEKEEGSSDKDTDSKFSITPFVRYYLDFGLFFQGQVGFGSQKSKNENGNTTTTVKYGTFDWGLGVGYAYFLNDHVALEPMITYGQNILKDDDSDGKLSYSGIGINVGLQVYLGDRN